MKLTKGAIVVAVLLSGCAAAEQDQSDIERRVAERIVNASCGDLRQNMSTALSAQHVQVEDLSASGGRSGAIQRTAALHLLYEHSHLRYHQRGCKPRIPYGA